MIPGKMATPESSAINKIKKWPSNFTSEERMEEASCSFVQTPGVAGLIEFMTKRKTPEKGLSFMQQFPTPKTREEAASPLMRKKLDPRAIKLLKELEGLHVLDYYERPHHELVGAELGAGEIWSGEQASATMEVIVMECGRWSMKARVGRESTRLSGGSNMLIEKG